MNRVEIKKTELVVEIRENMAEYQYYFLTEFHPEHGFMRLSQSHPYPYREGEDLLIPIPTQNPEGHGREADLLTEFIAEGDYPIWEDLEAEANGGLGVEEYLRAAEDEGHKKIAAAFEEHLQTDAILLAEDWIDLVNAGAWESLYPALDEAPAWVGIQLEVI